MFETVERVWWPPSRSSHTSGTATRPTTRRSSCRTRPDTTETAAALSAGSATPAAEDCSR